MNTILLEIVFFDKTNDYLLHIIFPSFMQFFYFITILSVVSRVPWLTTMSVNQVFRDPAVYTFCHSTQEKKEESITEKNCK